MSINFIQNETEYQICGTQYMAFSTTGALNNRFREASLTGVKGGLKITFTTNCRVNHESQLNP